MRKSLLLLSLILAGCTSTPIIIDGTVSGNVPAPPTVHRPYLEINNIDKTSSNSDKVKALSISVKQLMDYSSSLESYLEVYHDQ